MFCRQILCLFDIIFVAFFVVNVVESFVTKAVGRSARVAELGSNYNSRRVLSSLQGRRIADEEAAFAKKKKVVTSPGIQQPKVSFSPESALLQKSGVYDYTTLPYEIEDQDTIENYYGPIEIRSAGKKGRGLFVIRDVRMGELLFAEKAIAYKKENKKVGEVDYQDSAQRVESDLVVLVNNDPQINAQLSYLAHDRTSPNLFIPTMESFRQQSFVEVPILSATDVKIAIELNCFGFDQMPPSLSDREKMAQSLYVGVEDDAFAKGYIERQLSQVKSAGLNREEGSGLWILGAFLNHEITRDKMQNYTILRGSAAREFFGKILLVHALCDLKAGDEVTTVYSADREILKDHWGICEDE